ncbi:MAG: cell envelope integrity protein CreD, partial [Bacteroidales bacterium]|nr:cell envelope integrity protein CreD [Bacteroidales bacterium]
MEKERKITRFRNSVSFKLAIIVTLTLLLLIPTAMIKNLIRERELRNEETKNEITRKWGAPQTVAGPMLEIPYTVLVKKGDIKEWVHKKMYLIPDNLNVECEITPEIRNHSIYSVIAYKSKIHATGNFDETLTENFSANDKHIHWNEAKLIFEITDLRGIDSIIDIKWNGFPIKAKPGISQLSYSQSGFYAPIEI